MAINYQISRWRSQFEESAAEFSEKKRLDSALQDLWRQIYEMLEANGLLDSKRAWHLRRQWQLYCEKLNREGLRPDHFRRDDFFLSETEKGYGAFVRFRQSRIGR